MVDPRASGGRLRDPNAMKGLSELNTDFLRLFSELVVRSDSQ